MGPLDLLRCGLGSIITRFIWNKINRYAAKAAGVDGLLDHDLSFSSGVITMYNL